MINMSKVDNIVNANGTVGNTVQSNARLDINNDTSVEDHVTEDKGVIDRLFHIVDTQKDFV